MNLGLSGKVAIVTGGASGIGEAVVNGLLAEGAIPIVLDRKAAELETGLSIQLELTDNDAIGAAVAQVIDTYDRIDIVINNAGLNDSVGLDAGPDAFLASLKLNLVPSYCVVHNALNLLKANRGCVVNLTSKVATTGQGGTSGYAASKGGIDGLTREWALDLAPHGIRVNAVAPAETMTPMYRSYIDSTADPSATQNRIESAIPLGNRFTKPEEIAAAVIFLSSSQASHTTGQTHYVDGGYTHLDRITTVPPLDD